MSTPRQRVARLLEAIGDLREGDLDAVLEGDWFLIKHLGDRLRAAGRASRGSMKTMRYVRGGTVPRRVEEGRLLMHNRVRHSVDMPCGANGFRAWTGTELPDGFKRCRCGWSGLPHYSASADYECEPMSKLPGGDGIKAMAAQANLRRSSKFGNRPE